ncbi:glycoside hydrolase family 16 protein [Thermothelomyces thermophilus ATCC 42464]|uniref:Glycoside hydrolase family 16 protein n=1 Tax=Thermothelomyces thermophilus (strain ATCC 42464 / BCRC 31852 / DSM 1799) TaxID=573729 RepID=G2QML8_THET4|nr:glycoside hydrolase family 16 protein [Thermothelomyces thermophilus ATCC 42464]AEO61198.1 glycoside hydrolase family 16 protein [Thermothelomyces thermophilus ATCC 42464]
MDNNNDSFGRPATNNMPSMASTAAPTPQRPGTPNESVGRNPFGDGVESQASHRSFGQNGNPFASPSFSRPPSSFDSSSALGRFEGGGARYFHSRRVRKGEIEKPWTKQSDPKEKWVTILPIIGIIIGLGISGFLVWDGIRSVVKHKYCPVLIEDWSQGFNEKVWMKEVQVNGFGNGEFEQTTGGDENVFIENGNLIIRATPRDDALMQQNYKIDLLKDGTCTSTNPANCIAATNITTGNSSIVPPVLSGRINTRRGASIKYGRVEVTAKLPAGDWLWPAIWMMPVDSKYGPWPASGEIDIMESRGNNYTYPQGGNNIMSSALHWGPNPANDAWWRTNVKRQALHTTYSAGFNTFGVEWSQKYLFTYVNSRLLQVLYVNFDVPMWSRGNFPVQDSNGTRIDDIWGHTGRPQTPFDQPFYLILNLAVGGTNGWFEDNVNGKPWLDRSPNARKDFWQAKDRWLPTWTQPQMEVSKVVMLQQCDGDEDL